MAESDVKLLGCWPSPYVLRARIALNIKSVKYDYLEEIFGTKSDLLLKSNPIHKKIPVLIHGDNPICESLIIVQYIDEFWSSGPRILPSDTYDRAIARFWGAFIDDKLLALIREVLELRTTKGQEQKAVVEKMIEALELLEDHYVKSSQGKAFFGGESIGYIDIALGCSLPWLRAIEKLTEMKMMNETKVPNLVAWAERFCKDPAVKDVIPDCEKLLELFKMFIAKEQLASN
ncbi:hypothetical protein Leryth_021762 [Lithospermum erythrorhizon]|nr:hypothetical protein Leryth_021762 [Lithospermum erythrorhizon]